MSDVRKKLTRYGKAVRLKLLELEMTQTSLAKQIGCSNTYLNRILVGDRKGKKYYSQIKDCIGVDYISEDSAE